jgi:hypothetical protein
LSHRDFTLALLQNPNIPLANAEAGLANALSEGFGAAAQKAWRRNPVSALFALEEPEKASVLAVPIEKPASYTFHKLLRLVEPLQDMKGTAFYQPEDEEEDEDGDDFFSEEAEEHQIQHPGITALTAFLEDVLGEGALVIDYRGSSYDGNWVFRTPASRGNKARSISQLFDQISRYNDTWVAAPIDELLRKRKNLCDQTGTDVARDEFVNRVVIQFNTYTEEH